MNRLSPCVSAKLRLDTCVVADVVAGAAGPGHEIRRRVRDRDAEANEIREGVGGPVKAMLRAELETVGIHAGRYPLQSASQTRSVSGRGVPLALGGRLPCIALPLPDRHGANGAPSFDSRIGPGFARERLSRSGRTGTGRAPIFRSSRRSRRGSRCACSTATPSGTWTCRSEPTIAGTPIYPGLAQDRPTASASTVRGNPRRDIAATPPRSSSTRTLAPSRVTCSGIQPCCRT